ncbi:hypothetical protein GPALN_009727 [Globodera pallida]|nr:hypothetical protein GPALN_009727 [Globodera pallida]
MPKKVRKPESGYKGDERSAQVAGTSGNCATSRACGIEPIGTWRTKPRGTKLKRVSRLEAEV